ncbi:MAG: ATP-binding protein [Myxococcota bacterium]
MTSAALELACKLAEPGARLEAATALARALGAESLLVFVHDDEVDALLPAPGFSQTLPGGRGWAAFLGRCRESGRHSGEVAYPRRDSLATATALSLDGRFVLVLLGGEPQLPEAEALALPLLAALLHAEALAADARGNLAVERAAARHATNLAEALDKARRDLEAAFAESARLNVALALAATERTALLSSEQAANRSKDEFLAMLGHELRNPLAPIVTALELIRQRGDHGLEREHGVIRRQVTHLIRLVDDLLDVSRITGGKVALKKESVVLAEVVAQAVEMASVLLEARRHRFTLQLPPAGSRVHADEGRLAQILSNLLTNAARYTPPGGEISLSAAYEGDSLVLRVRDNGNGIEPAHLKSIFELFVQGPRALDRAEGGLGLGLCIVKNLVALHGGHVEARSAGPGSGSEFIVELPVGPRPPATDGVGGLQAEDAVAKRTGLRVLVVDDNEDAAELLGDILQFAGFEVSVCHDGPAALELTTRLRPDIAILDIGLPVMDGIELARRLRQRPELEHLRLIAATGYGQESDRVQLKAAGFEHHLVKPIDFDELLKLL